MQRARRLASVAVVASLAVAGLSACRQEPSVAAYVGDDTRITEARVQALWDDTQAARAAQPAQQEAGAPPAMAVTRGDIVRALVSAQVMDEVAKSQGVQVPADLPVADYASILGLPATAEYVQLYARTDTLVKQLREKAQGASALSDADLRQVYDVLLADEGLEPGTTFDAFKTSLPEQNKQLLQTAGAVRTEINKVIEPMDIKVNPRYQPLGISVLDFQTQTGALHPLVVAPLGSNSDVAPVTDIS